MSSCFDILHDFRSSDVCVDGMGLAKADLGAFLWHDVRASTARIKIWRLSARMRVSVRRLVIGVAQTGSVRALAWPILVSRSERELWSEHWPDRTAFYFDQYTLYADTVDLWVLECVILYPFTVVIRHICHPESCQSKALPTTRSTTSHVARLGRRSARGQYDGAPLLAVCVRRTCAMLLLLREDCNWICNCTICWQRYLGPTIRVIWNSAYYFVG